jgi:hypothetical protein
LQLCYREHGPLPSCDYPGGWMSNATYWMQSANQSARWRFPFSLA